MKEASEIFQRYKDTHPADLDAVNKIIGDLFLKMADVDETEPEHGAAIETLLSWLKETTERRARLFRN